MAESKNETNENEKINNCCYKTKELTFNLFQQNLRLYWSTKRKNKCIN